MVISSGATKGFVLKKLGIKFNLTKLLLKNLNDKPVFTILYLYGLILAAWAAQISISSN